MTGSIKPTSENSAHSDSDLWFGFHPYQDHNMDFFPASPGPFLPDISIDKKPHEELSLNLDIENFPEDIFSKQEKPTLTTKVWSGAFFLVLLYHCYIQNKHLCKDAQS